MFIENKKVWVELKAGHALLVEKLKMGFDFLILIMQYCILADTE